MAPITGGALYWSGLFGLMPSRPRRRFVPFFISGSFAKMSSSGMAKPMPESYHSKPEVSFSPRAEAGTITPNTRPSIATSGPP